ncbi:MAG: SulP family inorganic anion transporter [Candidatus Obscuribacter sp.]|nr:SulP family inorganic anion transporter [Candidatus Obscuribacter sp.]MBK9277046.1 SulP family inorganic anion transporter [Candidatus Obscuribacter sp.]
MFRWNPHVTTRESFTKDFLASLVVFLMALPLCMGIALASGVPVEKGILTGIIGGCLIGFITGSPLQVSGPAAGLTVLACEIVATHGLAGLAIIIVCAGLLQLFMGLARVAQIFRAVSPAVINGMMSGIGITLMLSQLHIIGALHPKAHALSNIRHLPDLFANILNPKTAAMQSVSIGILTIVVLILWTKLVKGRLAAIPGALVAVVAATAITSILHLPLATIPLPENIFAGIQFLDLAAVSKMDPWSLARFSVALAIIASAETLLSAAAVDKLHFGPRTQYDKELIAQGIGNTICGLLGALPMTGVIARSSVNVMSGATTNRSAIMQGLWLLLAVAAMPGVLRLVPVATLAALLLFTGFKLIDIKAIRKLWNFGPRLVGVYALTTIAIVSTDLLVGVAVGIALSVIKLVYTMTRLHVTIDRQEGKSFLQLRGAATFLSLPVLADALNSVPANTELHVCMEDLDYVDHACLELLMDWEKQHESTGGTLVLDWGELRAMFKSKRRARHIHPASTSVLHCHSNSNARSPMKTTAV